MFDFKSNEEMQLVPMSNQANIGKHFAKPAPKRQPKGLIARFFAALGLL